MAHSVRHEKSNIEEAEVSFVFLIEDRKDFSISQFDHVNQRNRMNIPYAVLSVAALLALLPDSFLIAQWNTLPDFPAGETDASFSFVIDDVAYVSGGLNSSRLYSFDGSAKTWKTLARMPGGSARPWAFAFAYSGKGYMGGGALNGSAVTDEFYEYDPAADAWSPKAPFGGGKRDGCISFIVGDKAYVGAGFDGQFIQYDFWEYSFATDAWNQVGLFPGGPVIFPSCFEVNGRAYVIGGGAQTETPAVFEFDPSNGWSRKSDFPGIPRQAAAGFVVDGIIYYGGGMAGYSRTLQDFWAYNPATDTWTKLEHDYPDPFCAWSVGFAVGGHGYVGTGANFIDQGIGLTAHMYSYPFEFPSPRANISTAMLDFGNVTVGTTATRTFTIAPGNSAGLIVNSVSVVNPSRIQHGYAVEADRTLPVTLSPGETLTFIVTSNAPDTGAITADLNVITNDASTPSSTIPMSAFGVADDITSVDRLPTLYNDLHTVPNPVNSTVEIILNLASAADVEVRVFDMLGRAVLNTTTQRMEAGERRRTVDLTILPAGAYVIEAIADDAVRRTTVVKVP